MKKWIAKLIVSGPGLTLIIVIFEAIIVLLKNSRNRGPDGSA